MPRPTKWAKPSAPNRLRTAVQLMGYTTSAPSTASAGSRKQAAAQGWAPIAERARRTVCRPPRRGPAVPDGDGGAW
ncbi:hypothetical protein [Streptomyces sp. YGL11-2]|uniref:hypothetical protein n=1 Tax=Streptomyces sp. YGL11-2 TaxID=3414028 RepID=UPI003CEFB7EF